MILKLTPGVQPSRFLWRLYRHATLGAKIRLRGQYFEGISKEKQNWKWKKLQLHYFTGYMAYSEEELEDLETQSFTLLKNVSFCKVILKNPTF